MSGFEGAKYVCSPALRTKSIEMLYGSDNRKAQRRKFGPLRFRLRSAETHGVEREILCGHPKRSSQSAKPAEYTLTSACEGAFPEAAWWICLPLWAKINGLEKGQIGIGF